MDSRIKERKNKYLEEFRMLEKKLKEIGGAEDDTVRYKDILNKAKQKNPAVEYYEGLLWDLYGLRNVFSHTDRDKYIAEVNDMAFEKIKDILKILTKPPQVGTCFNKNVFVTNTEDRIEEVILTMKEKLYTHVPVYNKKKFIGVLSETTIFDWLVESIKKAETDFRKKIVGDINPKYLNSKENKYEFISTQTSIFEIKKLFNNYIEKQKRLGVIFITKTGTKNQNILGIITAWDLPKIDDAYRE